MALGNGERPRHEQLMRLFAYLGRYAKQDMGSILRFPVSVLVDLAMATGELVTEEQKASERGS